MDKWEDCKTLHAREFYALLVKLHAVFKTGSASINIYFDPNDGCLAFNRNNVLWYNAYADCLYDKSPPALRRMNWYLTVCHEIAHYFQAHHDEQFSNHFSQIAMLSSEAFNEFDDSLLAAESKVDV